MKSKKKKIIIIISSIVCVPILIVALILTIRGIVHFPSCPKWIIRQYFVWNTPIGSSYDEVYTFLSSCSRCERIATNEEFGFVINKLSHAVYFADKDSQLNENLEVYGEKSLEVYLGSSGSMFPYSVYVFFAFDEDEKLIKVHVEKANGWP